MATMRTYDDGCAAAHALDLVGERWALLVIRELLLGPKRFTDLRAGLPNASPNVLAQRLRELEGVGVVRRRKLPPPAASRVYELTEWGMELEPVIISLGRWGARAGCPRHRQGIARTISGLRRGGGESSPSGGADLAYVTGAERRHPGHDGRRAPRALRWRAVRPGWDHRAGRSYRGAAAGGRRRAGHEGPDLVARLREHPPPPRPDADPRAPGKPGHQPVPLAPGPLRDMGPPDSGGVALEHACRPSRARRVRLHYRLRPHLRLPQRLPDRRPYFGGPGDRRAVSRLSWL